MLRPLKKARLEITLGMLSKFRLSNTDRSPSNEPIQDERNDKDLIEPLKLSEQFFVQNISI